MDSLYETDRKLSDLDDNSGVNYFLLDQEDVFQTSSMFQELSSEGKDQQQNRLLQNEMPNSQELFSWCPEIKLSTDQYTDHDWFNSLLEDPVLNDKMITDAVPSPRITSEHSYSINNDQSLNSSIGALCKIDDFGKDIDVDIFDNNHGALDLSQKTYNASQVTVKQEPMETEAKNSAGNKSITTNTNTNINADSNVIVNPEPNIISSSGSSCPMTHDPVSSIQPTIIFSTAVTQCQVKAEPQILSTISIKSEPNEFINTSPDHSGFESITLPPTPPSSNNSDSEGSLSPQRSAPSSPVRPLSVTKPMQSNKHITQPLFTNPIPQSGYLVLSEEEKRTLVAEGYPIPGKLPLTKQEEKNLKKIRRKIKNKISAQESRRKKKEYLEALEKRVEAFTQENVDLKKKVDSLETNNRSLLGQLEKLQSLCGKMPRPSSSSTQTGTVLMVVVLSFAVFLGSWAPTSLNIGYSSPASNADPIFYSNPRPLHPSPAMGPRLQNVRVDDYNTPSMKSRVLLSMKEDLEDENLFGPDIPMKNNGGASEFNNSLLKTNGSLMGKMPISWALSSFGFARSHPITLELNRSITPVSVAVYGQFYNESSTMAVNLKATMHPHIVSSSDLMSFETFGNATTEIESQ